VSEQNGEKKTPQEEVDHCRNDSLNPPEPVLSSASFGQAGKGLLEDELATARGPVVKELAPLKVGDVKVEYFSVIRMHLVLQVFQVLLNKFILVGCEEVGKSGEHPANDASSEPPCQEVVFLQWQV